MVKTGVNTGVHTGVNRSKCNVIDEINHAFTSLLYAHLVDDPVARARRRRPVDDRALPEEVGGGVVGRLGWGWKGVWKGFNG